MPQKDIADLSVYPGHHYILLCSNRHGASQVTVVMIDYNFTNGNLSFAANSEKSDLEMIGEPSHRGRDDVRGTP